jgi:signal transduction histidine kinase/CheY-like chemotaxis protein/HPt (histidine-containing phosphotransfer) domain-containing protein
MPGAVAPAIGHDRWLGILQQVLCLAVALAATTVLVGWALHIGLFKSVLPGLTTMKVNTAIPLLALAIAQWPPLLGARSPALRRLRAACALGATAIAAATCIEYLFHLQLGIDELIFADPHTTSPPYPGRPSPATAVGIALIGIASCLLGLPRRRWVGRAHWLAAAAAAIGALSLTGYAYNVQELYHFGPFVSIALHTSFALCALSAGLLLCRRQESWARILQNRPGARAVMARLVPASVVLPFATGLLVIAGVRAGYYEPMFGIAIFAVLTIGSFIALSWETAAVAARVEGALEKSNAGLQAARLRAEDATRAKTRFLAGMSHELRTPLHAILGYAELLSTEGELSAAQLARIDSMLATGQHMLETISSVLAMSEIEAGQVKLKPTATDLRQMAIDCVNLVRPDAEAKGLTIAVEHAADLPARIQVDGTRLRQIMVNLLGNAVKFTEQGSIGVRVSRAQLAHFGDLACIEVIDTGRGIPPARRAELFQDFQRLGAERDGSVEGAGLGLAIAAKLANMLGGRIDYADNPAGGSIFSIELPIVPVPGEGDPPGFAQPDLATPSDPETGSAARRVLVVDDMAMNREIAGAFLRSAGHVVTQAGTGEAGVMAASQQDFDVILMDVRMADMDGFEATRRIRALGGPRGRTPIVAMTAHAFSEQIEACREAGMDGHLAKPFNRATVLAAIEDAADRHSAPPHRRAAPSLAADSASLPVIQDSTFASSAAYLPAESLAHYLERLAAGVDDLIVTLRADGATGDGLADTVHGLAGRAGLLGFLRLAAAAGLLERAIRNKAHDKQAHAEVLIGACEASLGEIRRRVPETAR